MLAAQSVGIAFHNHGRGKMRKFEKSVLAVVMTAIAVACADPTSPARTLVTDDAAAAVTPHTIFFGGGQTYPAGLASGVIRLCKSSNATGSFDFTWSLNGSQPAPIPGGPLVVTDPLVPACRNIYTSTAINGSAYDVVVITEAADQSSNWQLTGRDVDQYLGKFTVYAPPRLDDEDDTGARSITVYLTNDMAKKATFTNLFTESPTSGCTYTKGWYQNKNGSPTVIGVDGRTKAEAQKFFAATPSKLNGITFVNNSGNAINNNSLLNLYQQLLAALNNLGGDANEDNGPDAVDAAIDAAQDGTNGTGLQIINLTLTQTQIGALTATLSAFNEGQYPTWPHCAD